MIISVDALTLFDVNGDGILDILYGDDQWGNIYSIDSITGEVFWQVKNLDHGVMDFASKDIEWRSLDLEGPCFGFIINANNEDSNCQFDLIPK